MVEVVTSALATAYNYAGVVILLAWFYWLFASSQRRLNSDQNSDVLLWVLGKPAQHSNWVSQFRTVFEAIFAKHHSSPRCMIASIISTLFLSAVVYGSLYFIDFSDISSDFNRRQIAPLGPLAAPFLIFLPLNILADYLSLGQTRAFINFAEGRGLWLRALLIPADIAATSLIFLALTVPAFWLLNGAGWYFDLSIWVSGFVDSDVSPGVVCRYTLFFFVGSFFTTFLTTAWYLIYVLGAFFARLLFLHNDKVTAVGELIGLGRRPVLAIGRAGASAALVIIAAIVFAVEIAPLADFLADVGGSPAMDWAFGWIGPVFAEAFAWLRDHVLC